MHSLRLEHTINAITEEMKKSKFTSRIALSDSRTLYFGALKDMYVVVEKEMDEHIESGDFSNLPAKVSDDLAEAGITVDDDFDEDSELIRLIDEIDGSTDCLQITVNPTINCNFRCWYCYEGHVAGSKMDTAVMESVVAYLQRYLSENPSTRQFNLSFFGGEPLLYFKDNVRPLIEMCDEVCKSHSVGMTVHFTTNGYLLRPDAVDFLSRYDSSFQITLDGGREFHDKTRCSTSGEGSFDTIIGNIRNALSAGMHVLVRVNYTEENLASVGDIVKIFRDLPEDSKRLMRFDFQRVWQDVREENKETIENKIGTYISDAKDAGLFATSHLVQDYVRNSCYGDKHNYLLVNYNGDLYKCTARDFAKTPPLGHLNPDGTATWHYPDYNERRRRAKFQRKSCKNCRIAPLCAGGCRQKAMEHPDEGTCLHGYSEAHKDEIILNRFIYRFVE